METRRQGDKETRRQGDKETRRQGDKETRRQGEEEASGFFSSPCLPIFLSPCPYSPLAILNSSLAILPFLSSIAFARAAAWKRAFILSENGCPPKSIEPF